MTYRPDEIDAESGSNDRMTDGSKRLTGPVACHADRGFWVGGPQRDGWVGRCVGQVATGRCFVDHDDVPCLYAAVVRSVSDRLGCSAACLALDPFLGEKDLLRERP